MTRWLSIGIASALLACGGAPSSAPPPEDEVSERWTAGDDAPLESDEE